MNDVQIRPVEPGDEEAVRSICFGTALDGRSLKPYLDDPALASDALIGYYLRCTPEFFFVADVSRQVAGYIAGCADTRQYEHGYSRTIVPRLILPFVLRGHWQRSAAWTLLRRARRHARHHRGLVHTLHDRYPAHLHINIADGFRGQGIGPVLIRRLLEELEKRDVAGVHLSVRTDRGRNFFEQLGFRMLASYPTIPVLDLPAGTVTIMGKTLRPPAGEMVASS